MITPKSKSSKAASPALAKSDRFEFREESKVSDTFTASQPLDRDSLMSEEAEFLVRFDRWSGSSMPAPADSEMEVDSITLGPESNSRFIAHKTDPARETPQFRHSDKVEEQLTPRTSSVVEVDSDDFVEARDQHAQILMATPGATNSNVIGEI